MNSQESTRAPEQPSKIGKGVAAAGIGFLSLVASHSAGAQEAPGATPPQYAEPAPGHEIVRPEDAVTTTTAAPEYVEPAPGHDIVRPEGVPTTTTAPPEYVEPAPGHEIVKPEDAVTTTTAAPETTIDNIQPATESGHLPSTGLDAETLAIGGGALVAAGTAAVARHRDQNQ